MRLCFLISADFARSKSTSLHTEDHDEVLDPWDTSYISWWYLTPTSSYHLWEAAPRAAWKHRSVLCPNQQYYGIAANVYLRAGRALIRIMTMMTNSRVNQMELGLSEQCRWLTGIKHTETDPEAVKNIDLRRGKIAGWYTVYCGYCWEDIRCTAVIANRLTEHSEWKV